MRGKSSLLIPIPSSLTLRTISEPHAPLAHEFHRFPASISPRSPANCRELPGAVFHLRVLAMHPAKDRQLPLSFSRRVFLSNRGECDQTIRAAAPGRFPKWWLKIPVERGSANHRPEAQAVWNVVP